MTVDLVGEPQLASQPAGLLEVIAEDGLVLSHPLAGHPLQPNGECLVQLGPFGLW